MKEQKPSKQKLKKRITKTKQSKVSSETAVVETAESSKKNTSLRLEKKTLKALKIIAIEKETSLQALVEGLIENYIKKHNSTLN